MRLSSVHVNGQGGWARKQDPQAGTPVYLVKSDDLLFQEQLIDPSEDTLSYVQ